MTAQSIPNVIYRSQSIDYLGFLRTKLRDLNGINAMAYELTQNADDVRDDSGNPLTTCVTFDFCEDALIVSNDGEFRQRDFDRMQTIASGDKRLEDGTTGSFGIGFISVYQVTDEPEIISSSRQWKIRPAEASERRIVERNGLTTKGTTFRLPWAFDSKSCVRTELGMPAIAQCDIDVMCDQVSSAVVQASLFLKQLKLVEIRRNGTLKKRIERQASELNLLVLQEDDRITEWILLVGDFDERASVLKRQYPQILPKRNSKVRIAIERSATTSGRLYATLPTEMCIDPLPFHINADFVPTSDRKRVIFESGADSEWNRAAVHAAACILAANVEVLKQGLFSHVELWKLIDAVERISRNTRAGQVDLAFSTFWEELAPQLQRTPIVYTASNSWVRPDEARVPITESEQAAIPVFQGLGINVPHTDLRAYFNTMRGPLKMRALLLHDVADSFRRHGLTKVAPLSVAPSILQNLDHWPLLWNALHAIHGNRSVSPQDIAPSALRDCAIALTTNDEICPPNKMFRSDSASTSRLFADENWLSTTFESPFLNSIVPEFGLSDAITYVKQLIARGDLNSEQDNAGFKVDTFYQWLDDRKPQLTTIQKQELSQLPVWRSSQGLRPLTELYVPGDFEDPLGLSSLVEHSLARNHRELLKQLTAKPLTFITYALELLPSKLKSDGLDIHKRRAAIRLLARKLSELQETEGVRAHEILSQLPLVECNDGAFRIARDAYLPSDHLRLFVPSARFANQDSEHPALQSLYQWLGINQTAKPQDIIARIREWTDHPPTPSSRQLIENAFGHLIYEWQRHSNNLAQLESQYGPLKTLRWLPCAGDTSQWYPPHELYARFQEHLFASQGKFLGIKREMERDAAKMRFLAFLGVTDAAPPLLIARHILACSMNSDTSLNMDVYRSLSQTLDDTALGILRDEPCLLVETGDGSTFVKPSECYWQSHPFGSLRHQLGQQWLQYRPLLDRLGVNEAPTMDDCVSVLIEIEGLYGAKKSLLDEDARIEQAVLGCWQVMHSCLTNVPSEADESRQNPTELRAKLERRKVIPNKKHRLIKPEMTFIEDRHDWASKFRALENEIIQPYAEIWKMMELAGAQRISRAEVNIAESAGACDAIELKRHLISRTSALARALEAEGFATVRLDEKLARLRITQHTHLTVQYVLRTFKTFTSEPEDVDVVYDAVNDELHVVEKTGGFNWMSLARELSYALSPTGQIGNLPASVSHVLSAPSELQAHQALNLLGVPAAQKAFEVMVSSPTAIHFGAVADPQIAMPPQLTGDEAVAVDEDSVHANQDTECREVPSSPSVEFADDDGTLTDTMSDSAVVAPIPREQANQAPNSGAGGSLSGRTDATQSDKPSSLAPTRTNVANGRASSDKQSSAKTNEILRSYVRNVAADKKETEQEKSDHRDAVDKAGVQRVLRYERLCGRDPQEQDHFNEGFDILSHSVEEHRYIEVKSLDGEWRPISPAGLSSAQFRFAQKRQDEFWLYVVEFARDDEHYQIYAIRNPAQRVTKFMFDDGWRSVADENHPPSSAHDRLE